MEGCFEKIPRDILNQIYSYLDYDETVNLSQTCKLANSITKNEQIWAKFIERCQDVNPKSKPWISTRGLAHQYRPFKIFDENKNPPVILDNGSGVLKAGFGGEKTPRVALPNVIGCPKNQQVMLASPKDKYIGNEAIYKRGMLDLTNPMEDGMIKLWDAMRTIWDHVFFQELKVWAREQPLILTELPLNSNHNLEKMTQVLFEDVSLGECMMVDPAVMSLYAEGKTSGLALSLGDTASYCYPFFEGYGIARGVKRLNFGGRNITKFLQYILTERGYYFETSAEMNLIEDIKKKLSFCPLDFEHELQLSAQSSQIEKTYELPDGQEIVIGAERFRCCESIFQPHLVGREEAGIHNLVYESIMACDLDARRELLTNIVVSGGTSLIPGLVDRLVFEVGISAPVTIKVTAHAKKYRQFTPWIGASIFSEMPQSRAQTITLEEYFESGPSIALRKRLW